MPPTTLGWLSYSYWAQFGKQARLPVTLGPSSSRLPTSTKLGHNFKENFLPCWTWMVLYSLLFPSLLVGITSLCCSDRFLITKISTCTAAVIESEWALISTAVRHSRLVQWFKIWSIRPTVRWSGSNINLGKKPSELTVADVLGRLEPEKYKTTLSKIGQNHGKEANEWKPQENLSEN